MIPIDRIFGYSLVSSILSNNIVRKGNIIGAGNFNILLLMESRPLALFFFNCFVPLESSSTVNGKSNTGSIPLMMCLEEELSSCVFPEQKSLEKCSTQLFGKIALRVSELKLTFNNFSCDQKRFGLSANDSNLLMLSVSPSFVCSFWQYVYIFFYFSVLSYDTGIFRLFSARQLLSILLLFLRFTEIIMPRFSEFLLCFMLLFQFQYFDSTAIQEVYKTFNGFLDITC